MQAMLMTDTHKDAYIILKHDQSHDPTGNNNCIDVVPIPITIPSLFLNQFFIPKR